MTALKLVISLAFAILGLSNFEGIDAIDAAATSLVIDKSNRINAPFTDTSYNRLHSDVFKSGRAPRSSDVFVMNASNRKFTLEGSNCEWGRFTPDAAPERIIYPHSSIAFGAESYGPFSGLECNIRYKEVNGQSSFRLDVENAYVGKNKSDFIKSGPIRMEDEVVQGNHNHVRFIIN